jgi:hypothetical protein
LIDNPKMSYVSVDGQEYGVTWQDRGDHRHVKIFKSGHLLGFKNQGLLVDTGYGVIRWIIRAIHKKVQFKNEFNKTKT